MAEEFKPGDLVRLKSGGYVMTVLLVHGPAKYRMFNDIEVSWHTNNGHPERQYYPAYALEKVDPKPDAKHDIAPM